MQGCGMHHSLQCLGLLILYSSRHSGNMQADQAGMEAQRVPRLVLATLEHLWTRSYLQSTSQMKRVALVMWVLAEILGVV